MKARCQSHSYSLLEMEQYIAYYIYTINYTNIIISCVGMYSFSDDCGVKHLGARSRTTLAPIPACREDFSRMKFTSLDKLIEKTCSFIKNVRLCSELDQKSGNFGVAPDAA